MSISTANLANDFHFRTKNGYKRPTVSVEMPFPTVHGIADGVTGDDPKVASLIQDAVNKVLIDHVRNYIDSDLEFDQDSMDKLVADGKVSIENIAHLPKADRNTLTKDDLEQFAQDYIAVMPEVTGKEPARIQAAAGLFVQRFKSVAGDNSVLEVLKDQLEVFASNAPEEVAERNERVIVWAYGKLEELMSVKVTADAL